VKENWAFKRAVEGGGRTLPEEGTRSERGEEDGSSFLRRGKEFEYKTAKKEGS